MAIFKRLQKIMALPLAVLMLLMTFPLATVNAAVVSTDEMITQSTVDSDRERVTQFMARDDVREQMISMGVDPDEALSRVDTLSDSEIQQIAGRMDEMPAGEGVVGPIVGALVLVFIVLLVTDLLCLTNFFPFTKCAAR